MKWYTLEEKLPEQGKKILCMKNGDFSVRQRFKDKYLPLPFTDSRYSDDSSPDKWAEIEYPEGYTGYITIEFEGKKYPVDELERLNSHAYELFISCLMNIAIKDENKSDDLIKSPKHYQGRSGLEAIDVIREFDLGFVLGNVVKYILRCDKKGNMLQDLEKAQWYLTLAIEEQEEIDNAKT